LAGKRSNIQIFASDIADDALETARNGIYPETIEADVSAGRLERFFTKEGASYRVNQSLRESVVFAHQNILVDAPFSNLDLICCRNLLIYLKPEIQEKLISLFHFAASDNGVLFLGNSETVGNRTDLYEPISRVHRIYRRIRRARHGEIGFPVAPTAAMGGAGGRRGVQSVRRSLNPGEISQRTLLEHFAPPSVLLTQGYEVLFSHGDIDRFLKIPERHQRQEGRGRGGGSGPAWFTLYPHNGFSPSCGDRRGAALARVFPRGAGYGRCGNTCRDTSPSGKRRSEKSGT
jgi:two-component system CheB/CheR fusion protein